MLQALSSLIINLTEEKVEKKSYCFTRLKESLTQEERSSSVQSGILGWILE